MKKLLAISSKLILIMLLLIDLSVAQSNAIGESIVEEAKTVKLNLSFGQSISSELFSLKDIELTSWSIENTTTNETLGVGVGETLYEVVFEQAGNYKIDFTLLPHEDANDLCAHFDAPTELTLGVSDQAVLYNFEELTLSGTIRAGVNTKGISLIVPAELKSLHEEKVNIPSIVYASGVGTSIIGTLDKSQEKLAEGHYNLVYHLSGTATKDSYLSFDFEDTNGNRHTYYHLQPIK